MPPCGKLYQTVRGLSRKTGCTNSLSDLTHPAASFLFKIVNRKTLFFLKISYVALPRTQFFDDFPLKNLLAIYVKSESYLVLQVFFVMCYSVTDSTDPRPLPTDPHYLLP